MVLVLKHIFLNSTHSNKLVLEFFTVIEQEGCVLDSIVIYFFNFRIIQPF